MRGLLILLLLSTFCVSLDTASAQDTPSIDSLEIALWPEYDRRAVLVIYRLRLAGDTSLPTSVSVPIPANVGEPHAVATASLDGRLLTADYDRKVEGEWASITVETDNLEVWVEYYDELTIDGEERQFRFVWPGGVELTNLTYEVQQPVDAYEVQITPPGEVEPGEYGLTYFRADLGPVDASTTLSIDLSYRKPNATLSAEKAFLIGSLPIESLQVALWPEFDRPAVLVSYRVRLSTETPLPTTVSLPIPDRVGDPHAVAKWLPEGGLDDRVPWVRQEEGEWATVTVETDTTGVWLEYYDDLTFDGDERSYTFYWPGGIEIGSFSFEVQQPAAASAMRVSPEGEVRQRDDGLFYHEGDSFSLAPTSSFDLEFMYANPSAQLSISLSSTEPTLVRPEATQGGIPDIRPWLPWVLGGFGFVFLAFGVVLIFRLRRERESATPRPRRRRAAMKQPKSEAREIDASPLFCHICGAQATVSDKFCRQCGTELRR